MFESGREVIGGVARGVDVSRGTQESHLLINVGGVDRSYRRGLNLIDDRNLRRWAGTSE